MAQIGPALAILAPLWAILAPELLSQSFGPKRVNLFGALGGLKIELSPRRGAFFCVCVHCWLQGVLGCLSRVLWTRNCPWEGDKGGGKPPLGKGKGEDKCFSNTPWARGPANNLCFAKSV